MHPPRTSRHRLAAIGTALAAALTLAGCSGGTGDDAAATTTRPTTTASSSGAPPTTAGPSTTASTTTLPPGVPVRTGGPTVRRDGRPDETGVATLTPDGGAVPRDPSEDFGTWPEYRLAAAAAQNGDGTRALGSGCSPANPQHLDDGLWYGYVNGLRDGVVSFDVACWWVGDLATVAGCEGQADLDSCVLNTSDRERTVPLARDAVFHLPRRFDEAMLINVDATFEEFAQWLAIPGNTLPVWVEVDRGALVEVEAGQLLAG